MIKVAAPLMACKVIDWAIQVHGGGGVSDDFPLAYAYAQARTLRLADGPTKCIATRSARWSWPATSAAEPALANAALHRGACERCTATISIAFSMTCRQHAGPARQHPPLRMRRAA
jgi:hypothetical protein